MDGKGMSAFKIHPPFVFSVFTGLFISGIIYYHSVLKDVEGGDTQGILGRADLLRYISDPVCLIIFGAFSAVVVYYAIQFFALKADKAEFESLLEDLEYHEGRIRPSPAGGGLGRRHSLAYILSGRHEGEMAAVFTKTVGSIPRLDHGLKWCQAYLQIHRERLTRDLYFLQFGVWVLPILGFIGTVLGISRSIAGLNSLVANTQQQLGGALQGSMQAVLSGLSTAFDTTFLGLVLTVVVMFATLILNRMIHSQLEDYYLKLIDRINKIFPQTDPS